MDSMSAHVATYDVPIATGDRNFTLDADSTTRAAVNAKCGRAINGHLHRKGTPPSVSDDHLDSYARDRDAGIWILHVTHQGGVVLELNHHVVSALSCKAGAAVLHGTDSPFERATDVVAAVSKNLPHVMSDMARTDFEFDLARWIPQYFDL
jgi:hypothetical protein